MSLLVSVVVATRNRHEKLRETLAPLLDQTLSPADYELIVVDDGSTPPIDLPREPFRADLRLIRLTGVERSAARNAGAAVARGNLLAFVDDDMTVCADFLERHLAAHVRDRDVLVVGRVRLSDAFRDSTFGRFRQQLEDQCLPQEAGPVRLRNFCTAQNMSLSRDLFLALGGFDPDLVSAEDQDLALRHSALDRPIVFAPDAAAVHRDDAESLARYCRRAEWGMENLIPFCRKHPNLGDNLERERRNGKLLLGREPFGLSVRKVIKAFLGFEPMTRCLHLAVRGLERTRVSATILGAVYRVVLGVHIQRGYRRGLTAASHS